MKIKEYSLEVTIGLPEFSNIKPNIVLEDVDSLEDAHALASSYLNGIWENTPEAKIKSPLKASVSANDNSVELTDMFGNKIRYDATSHTYSWEGIKYLSGSEYAQRFEAPFDSRRIAEAKAKKDGDDMQALLDEWELNSEVSRGLGTALHGALELFGKRNKLHANSMVKKAVESFYASRKDEVADYEVLVVDHRARRAGRIDRLVCLPNGEFDIDDFKTDVNIEKKLPKHSKQLNFYRSILEANGVIIRKMNIHQWNGEVWTTYEVKHEAVK